MLKFKRIFLDTNIYIIGDADKTSPESEILEAFGYRKQNKKYELQQSATLRLLFLTLLRPKLPHVSTFGRA